MALTEQLTNGKRTNKQHKVSLTQLTFKMSLHWQLERVWPRRFSADKTLITELIARFSLVKLPAKCFKRSCVSSNTCRCFQDIPRKQPNTQVVQMKVFQPLIQLVRSNKNGGRKWAAISLHCFKPFVKKEMKLYFLAYFTSKDISSCHVQLKKQILNKVFFSLVCSG